MRQSSGWGCWRDYREERGINMSSPVSTKSWQSSWKPKHGWIRACGRERGPAGLWAVVSVGPWLGQLWKAGNWFQQLPAALRTAAQTSGALWQIEADCWWRSIDFPFLNRGIISQEKHLLITRRKGKKKRRKKGKRSFSMDPATTAIFFQVYSILNLLSWRGGGEQGEFACGPSFGNAGLIWSEKSN